MAEMGRLGLYSVLEALGAAGLHWWHWELHLALVALGAVDVSPRALEAASYTGYWEL